MIVRESTRTRQERRETMTTELEERRREEREREDRRIEREHMKHAELMAVITRGNVPLPPQVTITR